MPQKTNLNISPYYDDFDKDNNFYKVLFRPGYPVQARELTGLQSILQNQVESFGKHMFKEGSMVVPGGIEYDPTYFSAKVNPNHLGIDVSVYLNNIISNNEGKGTRVRGQNSGIVATIKNFILPPEEGVDDITIFIKYNQSGTDGESTAFPDGEILILEENVTYGNTTLTAEETVLTLVTEDATATGSAFGINKGVYFIRGLFIDVPTSSIILDPYSNKPSYRVGLEIIEDVINANDDSSLYDNAKGFTNFAAPGADRFKVTVKLAKKALQDYDDTNFVELFRTNEGVTKKLQDETVYSEIKKYFAKRTFDESGNYAVTPFTVNTQNSLNDEINSGGLYTENQVTDKGNTPSDDLMCVKLSAGKAYVKGFDVYKPNTTVLDIEKPRDIKTVDMASIPFNMGSLLKINNVQGTPFINIGGSKIEAGNNNNVIDLHNGRKGSSNAAGGLKIGVARVYSFSLSDATYSSDETSWDLYLFDIQTYTTLRVTALTNPGGKIKGTRVRGLASGAIGYLAENANTSGTNELNLSQTTGTFIEGEQIIFNEKETTEKVSIKNGTLAQPGVISYNVEDIKSVFQSKDKVEATLASDFSADAVLFNKVLPNFSLSDELNISGSSTASVNGRNFANTGIKTDTIIAYNNDAGEVPHFNKITNINSTGTTLTLGATVDVTGICEGSVSGAQQSVFRIKVAQVSNYEKSSIFAKLPKKYVSNVDTSNSNLIINKQILEQPISSNSISFSSQVGLAATVGVSSVFFEPFDAERYSIHYTDGTVEPLTSDQVTITNSGNDISFNGLSKASGNATVNVTLKKFGATSKTKDYVRSQSVEITRTSGVSNLESGLTTSDAYGIRVEDKEISLNVPDVVKVVAVLESKTTSTAVLDKLKFVSGLSLNTNVVIGEKVVGKDSRAIGQVVSAPNATEITFVYLNANTFTIGEDIIFKESGIETVLMDAESGNFVNRTNNYDLEKGHKNQYCDYSKIVRKAKVGIPSKKLLVIFDKYQVATGNVGDLFTVNSYTKERYSKDIPSIEGCRLSDVLDFRPRVSTFDPDTLSGSPFAFDNRSFESTLPFVIAPNESSLFGYSYYLPRIDKLIINRFEEVQLIKGESDDIPVPPTELGDSMEIAEIGLPAYLFDTVNHPIITLKDNKRYTMRDIGALERRIETLETVTSLNALELSTQSMQVKDADGLDRFKSGFFVNNFKDRRFINFHPEKGSICDVDVVRQELVCAVDNWNINPELALNPAIDVSKCDPNSNLQLLDTNCKKTGDMITLDYEEIDWIENPHATGVENVNPFNVIVFMGAVVLDPPSDNWTRTIYVENVRQESTGAKWAAVGNTVSLGTKSEATGVTEDTGKDIDDPDSDWYRDRIKIVNAQYLETETFLTTYTNQLQGPSKEYDYVESIKVTSEVDPYMRSRNVFFSSNGLKPQTKHYHYLDNAVPDIVPKLVEIKMQKGTFNVLEDVKITKSFNKSAKPITIGFARIQKPNHKFGDTSRPEIGAGLGSPSVSVETYTVDPFDSTRPAPSDTYSATSKLLNIDCIALANIEKYYGFITKGAKIIGQESGAVAKVTSVDLVSDNWGDLLGAFFFRDPNTTPAPPVLFETGSKTFRVTAAPEGTIPVPGSTDHASDASGVFTATGTIETQTTNTVQVRNPPPPSGTKPSETTTKTNLTWKEEEGEKFLAPHRDPLAQSFTVDETGAFLTSFDVYFKSIDPKAKLFVELREVELGTPTQYLVQDYAQLSINPQTYNDGKPIETSDDASAVTTIKFQSPIYLESGKEYAIVFLSPASDKYELFVSTMGEKTIKTTNLPDAENVVVSKQYIGGSLFKSQNGTIWTASQFQDLTFKLRKAKFITGVTGTTTFYNTPIEPGNENTQKIIDNPIRSLPRKLIVKIDGSGTKTTAKFPLGRKVSTGLIGDAEDASITGIVEGQGSNITGIEIISNGSGYSITSVSNIPLVSLTGNGSGALVNLTPNPVTDTIDTATITGGGGTGYQVGDVLTVDNSNANVKRGAGFKVVVTTINSQFDTLYLTDVNGEKFTNNADLIEYGSNNNTRTAVANVKVNGDSTVNGDLYTGNVFEVVQYNHAHHGGTNQIKIEDVDPDTETVATTSDITADGTTVSVSDTTPFTKYSGITTDRGFALFDGELVRYIVGTGQLTLTRGQLSTKATSHESGVSIQTYEANGMPLVGINTTHTLPTNTTLKNASNIDNYYLQVNVGNFDAQRVSGNNLLSFTNEKGFGGDQVKISQNHQFSAFTPYFNVITPGTKTTVNTSVRTISGTSANGTEISFLDQGITPVALNETTHFPTPRLVASKVNEATKLNTLPKNKSLALNIDMFTKDPNLSPELDVKNATFSFHRNKINNPVGMDNYSTDQRTNQLEDDPHGSSFVTQRVVLEQPATSLKVLIGASVPPEADFRVFYRLFSADSSEVSQTYRPFPGYKNMKDTDGDGFGDDIIDLSQNDGRADAYVTPSSIGKFSEYQFSVDGLEQFHGFVIKVVMISTNESYPVRLQDFRAIALA